MKHLKIPIMRLKLICWDNFTPSPEIINLFSSDNSYICVTAMSWYLLSPSLIPLASVYSRGTRYPPMVFLWPHHRGAMSQELKKTNLLHESVTWKIMTSSVKARIWKWLVNYSKCRGSSCKKFNSGFQFQFQFQGFQFQFNQFQFQFQFRNWNWNWAAIPIPELNWPQPWSWPWPWLLVTKVRCNDLLDFRCQRAVDSSDWFR